MGGLPGACRYESLAREVLLDTAPRHASGAASIEAISIADADSGAPVFPPPD
ncbi:hypothetical protein ACWD4O_41650 [Streptomyces sp. NPDC002623]